jgi:hypothetical protein
VKIRDGFVSNSSSTSFIISNKTNRPLSLVEFVKENKQLVEQYGKEYNYGQQETKKGRAEIFKEMKADAERLPVLSPGDNPVIFGDEDGTTIGRVYDYILRDGGSSERFSWWFVEYLR